MKLSKSMLAAALVAAALTAVYVIAPAAGAPSLGKLAKQVKKLNKRVTNLSRQPGPQGPQGLQGPQGSQGPRGLLGGQGPAGPANVVTRTTGGQRVPGSTLAQNKQCNADERAVGGGGNSDAPPGDAVMIQSLPLNNAGDPATEGQTPMGWRVIIQQNSGVNQNLHVRVICASG